MAYTGHEDSLIRVRNLYTLVPYETYSGHLDTISSLCFDEVFNLYSAGFDGTVKKWNMAFRRVAFSFENRNDSVASLAAYQSQLFVGLKSGRIDCYHTEDAMSLKSLKFHSKAISSLIAFDDFVISSGFDGLILQFFSQSDGDFTTIHKTDPEPLKHLSLGSSFWIALQGDKKIIISPINNSSNFIIAIESQTPLGCVAATDSVILAGSKSGIVYA
jgi:WD40 repeat protein